MSSGPVVTPGSSGLLAAEFRLACARFATGVTVVTVADSGGQPHGLTMNSFTSVSLFPPLFLVCIDKTAASEPVFKKDVHLAVNVLGEEQQSLSRRFSGAYDDRFATVDWAPGLHGAPLLSGVLATIEGKIIERLDAGDHIILLAEARSTSFREGRPLVYYGSRYQRLGEINS
jgi:flavin reductase (DIM6/NTAB) family NADH-FMN oxidoreductase RutF